MKRIIKAATLEDMIDAFENRINELDASACDKITSTTWIDVDGGFGEVGAKYTDEEIRDYWDKEQDNDPVLKEYKSFEEWWADTKQWFKEDVEGCGVTGADDLDTAWDSYYGSDNAEIVNWLAEHDQAYNDAQDFFGVDDLMDVDALDLEAWISDHDQLWYDYCEYFKLNPDIDVMED